MKKKIILVIVTSFLSIVLIFSLHKICIEQNLKVANFKRLTTSNNLKLVQEIELPKEAYNFIGIKDSFILLTSKGLNEIIKINIKSNTYSITSINHKNHNSNILGDSIFSFDPYLKKVFIYDFKKIKLLKAINLNIAFDRALAIDKNTIILRSATDRYTRNIFSKFNLQNNTNQRMSIQLADSLEIDGGLKTDGFFSFNKKFIFFTQYKKGNIYKIDPKLNGISRYKTVDDIQTVDGVNLTKDSAFVFTKPVLNTNLLTSVSDKFIYNISFVKGDTEKLNEFTKYRMVDLYDLQTGKYLKSFYLPNNGIDKAKDFMINGEFIYLLFNKNISIYEIN